MNKKMSKAYEPQQYEDNIYKLWESSGFFNPDVCVEKGVCNSDAKTFTIVLPPPNITAKLHLGHSSMLAVEDLMIRYHRMKGDKTLWIPGTDHAAIATQNAVEKKILKEEGITRHQLGREKLLEKVWEFLRETQSTILHQTRKMGASLDWSREAFTLDNTRVEAVKKMFVDMYNDGIIYRGERVVNWCPRCLSTLADDEVEYKTKQAKLYTFKYSADFPFSIATTRPETKLGDTAIAINPKDKRYKDYIGKEFEVEFCGIKLKLKVIADWHVDIEFGTGALGVTPAHSMIDWQMAENNNLEVVKVIDENGNIRDGFGKFSGQTTLKARELIVAELKEKGLLEKEEEIENNLSVCYRCDTAIEPLPSKQWFVSVDKKLEHLNNKSLKESAIEVAKNGQINFIPNRFTKRYIDWMENLHDWCISRQIWFGHRIPVWYKTGKEERGTRDGGRTMGNDEIYVGITAPEGDDWVQDEDSLDTWFSSGMWTFSTLGWPNNFKNNTKTGDLANFHPTQVLETGYEIITLWVSRMIMMTLYAIGEIPFENVYLHGMILDKNGKKMSKTKGNGIDPIDMIEKYGTDAVRLSLLIGNTPGNDVRLSEEKIAGFRNFANKLWNICRFAMTQIDTDIQIKIPKAKTLADEWILERLVNVSKQVTKNIEEYNFSYAGEVLRDFTWNELADWYLEIVKIEGRGTKDEGRNNKSEILKYILDTLLKLWHPFIPFVTETIWQEIYGKNSMLMIEQWPGFVILNLSQGDKFLRLFKIIQSIITNIRSFRADYKIDPAKKLKAVISAGKQKDLLINNQEIIKGLARLDNLEIETKIEKPVNSIGFVRSGVEVFIDTEGVVDLTKEKKRIDREIKEIEKYVISLDKKLSNEQFINNAPDKVIKKEKEKLEEAKIKLAKLKNQLNNL